MLFRAQNTAKTRSTRAGVEVTMIIKAFGILAWALLCAGVGSELYEQDRQHDKTKKAAAMPKKTNAKREEDQ